MEHRHGEDRSASAQQSEREADEQREGVPNERIQEAGGRAAAAGPIRSSWSARVRMSNGF